MCAARRPLRCLMCTLAVCAACSGVCAERACAFTLTDEQGDRISSAMAAGDASVPIEDCDVAPDELPEFTVALYSEHPELTASFTLDPTFTRADDRIVAMNPVALEGSVDLSLYERTADAILAEVAESRSEFECAKLLHDRIVRRCSYDFACASAEKVDRTRSAYTAYGCLVENTAVCAGYSFAYADLLTRAGLANEVVMSDDRSHIWNRVRIDGVWYNVDVTADDLRSTSECFLVSDAFMDREYGFAGGGICTDDRYESVTLPVIGIGRYRAFRSM